MKQIAYLFLCENSINKIKIWEKYFDQNSNHNIYIHCSDPKNVSHSFIKKHLINTARYNRCDNCHNNNKQDCLCLVRISRTKACQTICNSN